MDVFPEITPDKDWCQSGEVVRYLRYVIFQMAEVRFKDMPSRNDCWLFLLLGRLRKIFGRLESESVYFNI